VAVRVGGKEGPQREDSIRIEPVFLFDLDGTLVDSAARPCLERLPRYPQLMAFSQLLGCQRRTEICVMLWHQRNCMIAHNIGQAVVRRPATPPVGNRRCAAITVAL